MYFANGIKRSLSVVLFSFVLFSCSPQANEPAAKSTPAVTASSAYQFELGTDYEIVRDTASQKPQLVEHFSLYCGHCYSSEALFSHLKSTLGKGVPFKRSHVTYFPQDNKVYGRNMTFAFVAAAKLGIEDEFVAKVFDYHFNDRTRLGEINDLKNIFVVLGQTGKVFEETITSEAVKNDVNAMVQKAINDKVRFTPDLIVNDKYRVKLDTLRNLGDKHQRLTALVKYLLTNP